jgi:hypothetical protein
MSDLTDAIKRNPIFRQVQAENPKSVLQEGGLIELQKVMIALKLPYTLKGVRIGFATTVMILNYAADIKTTGVE